LKFPTIIRLGETLMFDFAYFTKIVVASYFGYSIAVIARMKYYRWRSSCDPTGFI